MLLRCNSMWRTRTITSKRGASPSADYLFRMTSRNDRGFVLSTDHGLPRCGTIFCDVADPLTAIRSSRSSRTSETARRHAISNPARRRLPVFLPETPDTRVCCTCICTSALHTEYQVHTKGPRGRRNNIESRTDFFIFAKEPVLCISFTLRSDTIYRDGVL